MVTGAGKALTVDAEKRNLLGAVALAMARWRDQRKRPQCAAADQLFGQPQENEHRRFLRGRRPHFECPVGFRFALMPTGTACTSTCAAMPPTRRYLEHTVEDKGLGREHGTAPGVQVFEPPAAHPVGTLSRHRHRDRSDPGIVNSRFVRTGNNGTMQGRTASNYQAHPVLDLVLPGRDFSLVAKAYRDLCKSTYGRTGYRWTYRHRLSHRTRRHEPAVAIA